jgi:hypothetical protein
MNTSWQHTQCNGSKPKQEKTYTRCKTFVRRKTERIFCKQFTRRMQKYNITMTEQQLASAHSVTRLGSTDCNIRTKFFSECEVAKIFFLGVGGSSLK